MTIEELLEALGYADSENFLKRNTKAFDAAPDYGHIFRHAAAKPRRPKELTCRLQGVYTLRSPDPTPRTVPVVYVCEADSERAADGLHRLVWNQDVVPFLLVRTPSGIKLYSGFQFKRTVAGQQQGALSALTAFNQAQSILDYFRADAIDDGRIWKHWGEKVAPHHRVYWSLLKSLQKLDEWLQKKRHLARDTSHALIGKYVYLHYLRHRDILSDRKFENWNIAPAAVFGRNATRQGLASVNTQLDSWLNGSVFPLPLSGSHAPGEDHIRHVAATFAGDEPVGESGWQLHLDFQAYDFSYIPIETLSMIYEQFLHAPEIEADADLKPKTTKGERAGAYYTPIPVVNFMLAEMAERKPLQRGMKVLDASCGSGAFLVQCYRRLVEAEFPPNKPKPAPYQLKQLLQQSIFGVDQDPDACSVTELSLTLTLLDYVAPPDLDENPRFRLPTLRGENIFKADFFQPKPPVAELLGPRKFDWIVGNPPWKQLKSASLDKEDEHVWSWMQTNKGECPVGKYQAAQAFAWKCSEFVKGDGECGLLMPAMSLFEDPSKAFRAAFFRKHRVHTVANFSNLAEVLFAGRSRVPAAAFFFSPRPDDAERDTDEAVTTFSPLVANQEATRPVEARTRNESWSLIINGSEIREIPLREISDGSGLPWKLATWGSHLDSSLLSRLARKWPSLESLEDDGVVIVSEGLQLRPKPEKGGEDVEEVEEVRGKRILDVDKLKRFRHIFAFPKEATPLVPEDLCYARKGRAKLPLSVCRPPHVVIGVARNFAVFTEEFLVVPPRQIGIASPTGDKLLLKAMALFLSSDFAFYHQFLVATQFGVQRGLATLSALRRIPIPFPEGRDASVSQWTELYRKLCKIRPLRIDDADAGSPQMLLDGDDGCRSLLEELNQLVSESLGLTARERALVHDLVHARLALNDGKLGAEAIDRARVKEVRAYAARLKQELDGFAGDAIGRRHEVAVIHDDCSGMVQVEFTKDMDSAKEVVVHKAEHPEAKLLEKTRQKIREQRAQWVYFDRNLRIYEGRRTYLFKPMQRFHWTESQAMIDASQIIAETLGANPAKD